MNVTAPVDVEMKDTSLEQAETEKTAKDALHGDSASTGNSSLSVSLFVHTDDVQDDLDDDLKAVENGVDVDREGTASEEISDKGLLLILLKC